MLWFSITRKEMPRKPMFRMEALSGTSVYFTGRFKVPKDLRTSPYSSMALSLCTVGSVPDSLFRFAPDFDIRKAAKRFQDSDNLPGYGRISILQEGGCKARVVAIPSAWNQFFFRPLHDQLMRNLALIEGDGKQRGVSCVLNQNKGAIALQHWMEKERSLWSFDLESATDRFPRRLQTAELVLMGMKQWTSPLDEISQGQWLAPPGPDGVLKGDSWSYTVGQPMGLSGSFPLFHLSHHALLSRGAEKVKAESPAFLVLGDDVLISDRNLAAWYNETVQGMGITISKGKSYEGPDLQTFAGFTGVRTPRGTVVFRPFKHGPDFSISGKEVNVLNSFGKSVDSWSGWWATQRRLFDETKILRNPDLSPTLSTAVEIGLNPDQASSRWFGSTLNRLFQTCRELDDSLVEEVATKWRTERSLLFVQEEDTQTQRIFDPKQYARDERVRKRNQLASDPLMRAARESHQSATRKSEDMENSPPSKPSGLIR